MSYNIKGLETPHKKHALDMLVKIHIPNIVLIQETMVEEGEDKSSPLTLLKGWNFLSFYFIGRSGGL
jgi:exonuclease III